MAESIPNLRHLVALRAVAEMGSMTTAAKAVHLSQPAVTQAVAALEQWFGAELLLRSNRGVRATPAGAACAVRIGRALDHLREAFQDGTREPTVARVEPLRAISSAQLEALVAVVRAGSFARAARAGHVARTTVHRATRQLELAVGVPLFESTSHGVRPTRAAERLARCAQLAAGEIAQARAEVAALTGAERGGTVIGAMPLARSRLVPSAVLAFARRHPGHAISVLDGPYESMLDALRRARADVLVGALRDDVPDDVVQQHLFDDSLAIIVRREHPLVVGPVGGRPRRADLLEYPWIAPRSGSPLRRHFESLVRRAGANRVAAIECNSLIAARAILLGSDRVMLLSAQQVDHEITSGELTALPHPDGRVVRAIGLTVRRRWQPTGAQVELLDALRCCARHCAQGGR